MTDKQQGIATAVLVILVFLSAAWAATELYAGRHGYCGAGTVSVLLFLLAAVVSVEPEE